MNEFSVFLQAGLNRALLKAHAETPAVYQRLVNMVTARLFTETYPNLGDVTDPEDVEPGEIYPEAQFIHDAVTLSNVKRGHILSIERELLLYDQINAIQTRPARLGAAHQRMKDKKWATLFNDGDTDTCYDGQNLWDTGGHPDRTGGSVVAVNTNDGGLGAITEGNIETALQEIALWRRIDGETGDFGGMPMLLVVATNQQHIAFRILRSPVRVGSGTGGVDAGMVLNIHRGTFAGDPVVWHRLGASEWYIVIPSVGGLVHQTKTPLGLKVENRDSGVSFERDVWRWRSDEIFGHGLLDWRVAYKGN
jgi:hypothetical protein